MRFTVHALRRSALLAVFLTFGATLTPAVVAQEEIDFRILKLDCTSEPADDVPLTEQVPDACEPAEGASFAIEDEAGNALGSCTTDADGRCMVSVPNEATVTVTEDEPTGTDGFAPRENPITTQAVTEFAGAVFVNLPEPPALPDTGTGTAATTERPPVWAALLCGITCALLAFKLRKRRT
ncbi:MAG: hypothetical protein H0W06_06405 [Chloroflexia bacterium]|nr:hypothetical protein [Chloroflexia bacterium]